MNPKKFLIFDAGAIISLTMNGLLPILEKLKENFEGEFVVTPAVKREIVDRPLRIKKYSLEGVKVKHLLEKGILKLSTEFLPAHKIENETKKVLNITNKTFKDTETGKWVNLLHEGEASCIAFSRLCNCENLIVIDERTTRMLTEKPKDLENMMEKKLHTKINSDQKKIGEVSKEKYIRSTELMFVAFKKGLVPYGKSREVLDALLYGLRYKGAAISSREIETMKKSV